MLANVLGRPIPVASSVLIIEDSVYLAAGESGVLTDFAQSMLNCLSLLIDYEICLSFSKILTMA